MMFKIQSNDIIKKHTQYKQRFFEDEERNKITFFTSNKGFFNMNKEIK